MSPELEYGGGRAIGAAVCIYVIRGASKFLVFDLRKLVTYFLIRRILDPMRVLPPALHPVAAESTIPVVYEYR